MWLVGTFLLVLWFILSFALHKTGYIHMLLIGGISLLIIQFAAHRKASYHRKLSKQ